MRWIYRGKPLARDEIARAITNGDLRAGWQLNVSEKSDWQWGRLIYAKDGSVLRCEAVRECSAEEKGRLNDLLKGEICCRVIQVPLDEIVWALASID